VEWHGLAILLVLAVLTAYVQEVQVAGGDMLMRQDCDARAAALREEDPGGAGIVAGCPADFYPSLANTVTLSRIGLAALALLYPAGYAARQRLSGRLEKSGLGRRLESASAAYLALNILLSAGVIILIASGIFP
jgi:hypothetical protein